MSMNNGRHREIDCAWELPKPEEEGEGHGEGGTSPLFRSSTSKKNEEGGSLVASSTAEEDDDDLEDPLMFHDEPENQEEGNDEGKQKATPSSGSSSNSRKWLLVFLLSMFMLIWVIPVIMLTVDKKLAEQRMRSIGTVAVQGISVDVSESVPVVGLQVSVKKSAFPKFTHLKPESLECELFNRKWGSSLVASIKELEDTNKKRNFFLNATLVPPQNDDLEGVKVDDPIHYATLQDVTQTYATVAWQILTRQTTFVSTYKCNLHLEAKVGNMITWQHSEIEFGTLDLKDLWDTKERKQPSSTAVATSSSDSLAWIKEDDGSGWVQTEQGYWVQTLGTQAPAAAAALPYYDNEKGTVIGTTTTAPIVTEGTKNNNSTDAPTTAAMMSTTASTTTTNAPVDITTSTSNTDADTNTNAPMAYTTPPTTTQEQTSSIPPPPVPQHAIVVHKLSADGIVLGIRLQLPPSIFNTISNIQVKLPTIQVKVGTSLNSQQPMQLTVQEMDLSFTSQSNHHYATAEVGCGTSGFASYGEEQEEETSSSSSSSSSSSCPWYNPLISLISDTLQMSHLENAIVSIEIDANNSFLEQMVGPLHAIVLYRIQMTHHQSRFSNSRRNLQGGGGATQVDCIRAQDALFGDIFEFSWCMNLEWSKGLDIDGSINFYGYGGSLSSELDWYATNDGVLTLDANAQVDLQLKDQDADETKMDLQGSAALDLINYKVALYANNTADWKPFRFIMEASVEYDDPNDMVIIRLDNGTLEVDGQQYIHGTSEIIVDNPNSQISMVVDDPRLDMAFDGSISDNGEGLEATWSVHYDEENIVTGDSSFSLPYAGCTSSTDDYYTVYADDDGLWGFLSPCDTSGGLQFQSESDGKLTTKFQAQTSSNDDKFVVKIQDAKVTWDGEDKVDVAMSMVWDWNSVSLDFIFEEKTRDHEITFKYAMPQEYDFRVDSEAGIRIDGEKLFSSTYQMMTVGSDTFQVSASGEAGDLDYSMAVQIQWSEDGETLKYELKDASFKVDNEIIWKMSGTLELEDLAINDGDYSSKVAGTLEVNGEALSRTFDLDIAGNIDSNPTVLLESKGTSSLIVDNDLLWSESAHLLLPQPPINSNNYKGTFELEPTSSDADVQMETELTCEWDDDKETFSCELPKLQLSLSEEPITDATGDLLLDLPGLSISLNMRDEYDQDNDGYVVSISGNYEDDILTGKVNEIKVVSDGETTRDTFGEVQISISDVSVSYVLEDLIVETLMGLDYGGVKMGYNQQDEFETMDIRAQNMRMVMRGDPWVHGNMHMGLDMVKSTFSMAMDNNTTKLPMDFDFTISIGEDDMSMAMSVVSSPPPSPPTPVEVPAPAASPAGGSRVTVNTTILIMNLEGLDAEELNKPENQEILAEAFEDFVKNLILSLEEDSSSSEGRRMLQAETRRRRLTVTLLADTATVYGVSDVDCPTESTQDDPNAKCQHISGGYELAVMDEDPEVVREKYIRETDKAVEDGKMQESLKKVAPEKFPDMVVLGAVERPETMIPVLGETQPPAEDDSAGTRPFFSIAWMAAIWTMSCLLL